MAKPLDIEGLRSRQATYLPNHYLSTHITAVGIALGVAGITAASLIGPASPLNPYQPVFWLLFMVGLLATAAAYAGTMVGAILLPATLPGVTDLLLPLALTLSEFLLFGILAYQITGLPKSTAIIAWWYAFSAFGLATFGSVLRARFLIRDEHYEGAARWVAGRYRRRMRVDLWATAGMCLFGGAVGSAQLVLDLPVSASFHGYSAIELNIGMALLVGLVLLSALIGHSRTASQLRVDLADQPPAVSS